MSEILLINELSLEAQYPDNDPRAIRDIVKLSSLLRQTTTPKNINFVKLIRSNDLDHKHLEHRPLVATINHHPDKLLKPLLRSIFKCDRAEEQTDPASTYLCQGKDVTNTSLSFACKKVLEEINTSVFCFSSSIYSTPELSISSQTCNVSIKNIYEKIEQYFSSLTNDDQYPTSASYTPFDRQTILANTTRFTRTSFIEPHGHRRVFYEKENCRYWYVDNLHIGQRAHLEVFDSHGEHLGEADLVGNIDTNKKDSAKKINI